MQGDDSPLLVTRRACFTPCKSEGEDWLKAVSFKIHVLLGARYVNLSLILEVVRMWY